MQESPAPTSACASSDAQAISVVVGAYPGSRDIMQKVWDRFYDGNFKILEVPQEKNLRDVFIDILKDTSIADRFTYVPANMVPCTHIAEATLRQAYVYISRDGRKQYNARIPITADKDKIAELLLKETIQDDENFAKAVAQSWPMEVGFSFGNFITPVLRANPCENVVIEAFLRKFFVAASQEGFTAITGLISKALLHE